MAETKKKRNVFQKIASFLKDVVEWVEETFSDPALSRETREDLGLNADNPATPKAVDPAVRQKIDAFLAKQDVDEIALAATAVEIKALARPLNSAPAAGGMKGEMKPAEAHKH